ncbi:MAG: hypothetical protein RL685_786 [Pseudomonadota bacterium]|jgi:hypothetical protein
MSGIALLLGLLVLSYLGGILRGGRTIQGFGLPSGAEYLCLGFVLGAHVLDLIPEALLVTFRPLLLVGASWIALVAGLSYTRIGARRIRAVSALIGVLSAALVGLAVGALVWFVLPYLRPELGTDRGLIAGGMAIVSCASTRHAVSWVVQRYAAKGPLSDALADYARVSVLVPILGLSVLLAQVPEPGSIEIGFAGRFAVTWLIGILLGLVAVLLIGRGLSKDESWGVIVGTFLLAVGVASQLGFSAVAASFALGSTLGLLSSRRAELVRMVRPTESAVHLPLAVLAGALVSLHDAPLLWVVLPLGVGARLLAELIRGTLLWLASPAARPAGPLVGLGLMSMGEITLACAVSLALSFQNPAINGVFAVAVVGVLVGELVGPLALRRALRRADELEAGEPEPGRISLEPEGSEG